MGTLDGKVALITGSGAGIGRETALALAGEGAAVVVNDVARTDDGPAADAVVAEIVAGGGRATANTDSVSDPDGAARMVRSAIATFGTLDILVNNAGILRDRMFVNMSLDEWDAVIAVHLRGVFLTTHAAAEHWRERSKAGEELHAAVVNMTSGSGLHASLGQANYAAAKSGIATFTQVIAKELGRYGVRANAVAPTARTQLTSATPGLAEIMKAPDDPDAFDKWNPNNVASVVAFLVGDKCALTGQVLGVFGDDVGIYQPWTVHHKLSNDASRWSVDSLAAAFADDQPLPPAATMM